MKEQKLENPNMSASILQKYFSFLKLLLEAKLDTPKVKLDTKQENQIPNRKIKYETKKSKHSAVKLNTPREKFNIQHPGSEINSFLTQNTVK